MKIFKSKEAKDNIEKEQQKTKLSHTILELDERRIYSNMLCNFCVSFKEEDKIVCQIRTHSEVDNKILKNNFACQKCKEKFENDELPKCKKCGRLKTDSNVGIFNGKYVCDCEMEEVKKELLPQKGESINDF